MLRWGSDSPRPHTSRQAQCKQNTKPPLGAVLCSREYTRCTTKSLFDRVLQSLGSAEFRCAHRLDLDSLARARVPPRAAGARLRLEDAEARDRDLLPALERAGDHSDDSLDRALCIGLRAADGRRDLLHQIHFICHRYVYLRMIIGLKA